MPSERVLEEKKLIVEQLSAKLKSKAGVLINYSGITANEDTAMRVKMREANVDYTVVKNTLMRFAIKNVGFDELDPLLNGTTSLAVSEDDPIAPARIIKEHADKFTDYFEIKAGFMDGKVLSANEVNALASIPPLPILRAQLLGTMLAPIAGLAIVLKAIAERGVAPMQEQSGTVEPSQPLDEPVAPAETPAEAGAAIAEPVKEAAAEPAVEATEAPVKEATEAPVKEATEAPVKEAAAEPVVEAAAEPAVEKAEEPVKKPSAKKTSEKQHAVSQAAIAEPQNPEPQDKVEAAVADESALIEDAKPKAPARKSPAKKSPAKEAPPEANEESAAVPAAEAPAEIPVE